MQNHSKSGFVRFLKIVPCGILAAFLLIFFPASLYAEDRYETEYDTEYSPADPGYSEDSESGYSESGYSEDELSSSQSEDSYTDDYYSSSEDSSSSDELSSDESSYDNETQGSDNSDYSDESYYSDGSYSDGSYSDESSYSDSEYTDSSYSDSVYDGTDSDSAYSDSTYSDSSYSDSSYSDSSYSDSDYTDSDYSESSSSESSSSGSSSDAAGSTEPEAGAFSEGTADSDSAAETDGSESSAESGAEKGDTDSNAPKSPDWPSGPEIDSFSAVILEENTGTILYQMNMEEKLLPSSSVKIMTCLVALENSKLTDEVVITETGTAGVTDGGAHISAQVGEIFTMEQCLYAIMIASANDIALQVAEHVGGTVDHFVEMMNEKAKELGCKNTRYSNPTGLYSTGQESTAYDQALIMMRAMSDPSFAKICRAPSYTIPATNLSGGSRALTNKFPLINVVSDCYYSPCVGGKEGYTSESGSVLTCKAVSGDLSLICSIMGGIEGNTPYEALMLLDYCFENFRLLDLGRSDFSVLSGGKVVIPSEADESSVSYQDTTRDDGSLDRTYYYHGTPVGKAVAQVPVMKDDTVYKEGQKNMSEALAYSEDHSSTPYIVIAVLGILLIAGLGFLLYKQLKP